MGFKIKTITIELDDRKESLTEQLEDIISAINDDEVAGYGWSIEEE